MIFNLKKHKKHISMCSGIRGKQIDNDHAPEDMFGIDSALITFAYQNISTKELKRLIKKEEEEIERTT